MQCFLKIDGIKGQVKESKHKEWIAIDSFSFGVSNPSAGDPSKTGKLRGAGATFSDVSITKECDITTPEIMKIVAKGDPVKEIQLHVCEDSTEVTTIYEIKLTNAIISSYSIGGGGTMPSESMSFSYSKIYVKVTPVDAEAKKGAAPDMTWDLLEKKAS